LDHLFDGFVLLDVPGALSYSLPNENFNDISIPTAEILYSDYMNIITLVASGSLFLPLPAKLSDGTKKNLKENSFHFTQLHYHDHTP
jgi:hypothetical protein